MSENPEKIRVDKWLWQARFFKTRSLSAKLITAGHLRVNGTKIAKPAYMVIVGDTLTFAMGEQIRVVRIIAPGTRRGPATEAQLLYDDLTPVQENVPKKPRDERKGRPDKRERRQIILMRARNLE